MTDGTFTISFESNCRCCFTDGCRKDMQTEYTWMNKIEVYSEMLAKVFNITIPQYNDNSKSICEVCITRLRDAEQFRVQVLETQMYFEQRSQDARQTEADPLPEIKSEMNNDDEHIHASPGGDVNCDNDLNMETQDSETELSLAQIKRKTIKQKRNTTVKRKGARLRGKQTSIGNCVDNDVPSGSFCTTKHKGTVRHISGDKSVIQYKTLKNWQKEKLSCQNTIGLIRNSNICLFRWQRNLYKCFCCIATFNNIVQLKYHTGTHTVNELERKVIHRNEALFKVDISSAICKLCSNPLKDLNELKEHLVTNHNIPLTVELNNLIPFRLENNAFNCELCQDKFDVFHKLNVHMNAHYNNFICETCGLGFTSLLKLKDHVQRHAVKTHKCQDCNVVFTTQYQKDKHAVETHKRVDRRVCPHCPQRFKGHYGRLVHMIREHGVAKPEFKCGSCDKVFLRQFLLNSHLRKFHMKEKNHGCELCGIKFFGKYDLRQHMSSHTGEKKHMCSICGKSYARRGTLRDHLKIHDNA